MSIVIGAFIVKSSFIGNVYPSIPLVTVPVVPSTIIVSSPKIPSLF